MDPTESCLRTQQKYWKPDAEEQAALLAREADLDWNEQLRLLHLLSMDFIGDIGPWDRAVDAEANDASRRIRTLAGHLISEGPLGTRECSIWHGEAGQSAERKPDLQGPLRNASLTHLGCLEVMRINKRNLPKSTEFIPFDDLRGLALTPPSFYRYAKLFYDDDRPDEIVILPQLYGLSWKSPHEEDRDGSLTRFLAQMEIPGLGIAGIGIGQQDFVLGSSALVAMGSVGEVMVALRVDDPKFEDKCRARGLDPAKVRQELSPPSGS